MRVHAWLGAQLLVLILAGCASHPADKAPQPAAKGSKEAVGELYAGDPPIVHGTEYPVISAADGIQRGDQAWSEGKPDLAIYLYVESLQFDSTSAVPFLKIGAIHEQRGNRELAEKAFEFALERQPDNAAACERLGLLYLQDRRNDEASALLKRAVALDPKRWRSYDGLGVLADRRNDFPAAIGYYDQALEIDPKSSLVMNNRGYSHYLAGDLQGAEADLKAAIRLGGKGGVWTNLGKVQARQGRYPDALESLTQEMDLAHAYNLLGEAAMVAGDYARAKRYFESSISAAPRYNEAAQKNLGLANERLLAAPTTSATKVVVADTPVYADGAVIGLAERDDRVEVLRTQQGNSLVRFKNRTGAEHIGWVPTTSLTDPP